MGLFLIYLRYIKYFEHSPFFLVNSVSLYVLPAENPNRAGPIFGPEPTGMVSKSSIDRL